MVLDDDFEEPEPPEDDAEDDELVVDDNPNEEFVEYDPTGRYGRYAEILGKGAMKTVHKAYDMKDCKEVAWNKARPQAEGSEEQLSAVEREVGLLQTLSHKGVLKIYSAWVDKASGDTNFITELCSSTLLAFRLKHKHISRKAVKSWARQILEGLAYLHTQEPPIIHRDLKCENIFLKSSSSTVLKIGDFGSATLLDKSQHMHTLVGTPEFMAPEMYEEDYNELVDVYSFGMCILELLTRECPYSECTSLAQIYSRVTSGIKPKALLKVKDIQASQFINRCLLPMSKRPAAMELLNDPFLQHKDSSSGIQVLNLSCSMPNLRSLPTSSTESSPMAGGGTGLYPIEVMNAEIETVSCPIGSTLCRSYQVTGTVEDECTLRLKIRIQESSRSSDIMFPFDLRFDTPEGVAAEMVGALSYPLPDMLTIADSIRKEILALIANPENGLVVSYCAMHEMGKQQHCDEPIADVLEEALHSGNTFGAAKFGSSESIPYMKIPSASDNGSNSRATMDIITSGGSESVSSDWIENGSIRGCVGIEFHPFCEHGNNSRASFNASYVGAYESIRGREGDPLSEQRSHSQASYLMTDVSCFGITRDGEGCGRTVLHGKTWGTTSPKFAGSDGEDGTLGSLMDTISERVSTFWFAADGNACNSKFSGAPDRIACKCLAASATLDSLTGKFLMESPMTESSSTLLAGKFDALDGSSAPACVKLYCYHATKNPFKQLRARIGGFLRSSSQSSLQRPRPLYVNVFA